METKTKKWVVAVLFAVLFACVALLSLGVTAFTSTRARAATGDTITSISIAPESDTTRFYNFETLGELKTESEIGGEAVGPRLIVTATYDNNPSLTERLAASAFTLTTEGGLKETDTLTAGQHTVIATLNSNAEISERCTIEVRDNEIVSISATYDAERAGEISPTTQLGLLRRYITITGKYANGDPASNISNWSIEGDLAAPRDNTSETYSKVVKIVYNDDAYVKPYELTITNIKAQDPTGIYLVTSSDVSYGAGTKFDPSEAAFDFTIMYSTGVITLRYSASDTRFSFSYTNEEGEAICDADGNVRPGMEAYADKDAFEYYITTNNTDYLYIYYTENGKTVEYQIIVNVFKSAHSIVILNSDGTTYRPGQTTSGLTYDYEVTDDNAATGKAHSFDLDNTGYEFDPEIMKISVSGNREGGEAINSGIVIETAASKQTGEVRLTEVGTYTVTVALTNPGYYWSGYEESVSELSFTVKIEKAELKDLSVSVGHTTYDDSEVQKPGWTYGKTFQEEWVTYAGNYGGGDVTWHYSGTLNAGTDYDNAQAPTDAGAYKVYVDITETDNFKAGSTSTNPAEFIVGKQEIKPKLDDSEHNILQTKTYAGTPLTADAVADGRYSILTNAQNAQNVGTYSVTLKLTDSYNYRWDTPAGDVGSDAFANREVLFEIVAKQVTRPQSAFTNTYSGIEQTIDLNLDGKIGNGSTDAFQALVKGTATRHSGIGDTTPVLDWYISGDTVSATSAAVYKVTVKLNNTVSNGDGVYINYVWADDQSHDDMEVTWTIEKAHNPISVTMDDWTFGDPAEEPSATATFNQEGAKYEFYKDEACLTPAVGDDASQKPTAAGTYWVKATIAATGDYGDKAQGFADSVAKDSFTIVQATLALPEIAGDDAYYTYSGGRIDVKIKASYLNGGEGVAITRADQFSEYFTFSGKLNGKDAGDYVLTVTLNSNYKWESGTDPFDLDWSILRAKIAKPTVTGDADYYTYKEDAINIQILAEYLGEGAITVTSLTQFEEYFTFTGQFSETNANSYALTVSLNSNYQWSDNGDAPVADITLNWSIAQGVNEVTSLAIANSENWTYDDGSDHTLSYSFKFNKEAEITVTYYRGDDSLGNEQPTDAGSYRVVVSVAETGNYKGASKELSFTIARKTVALPEVDYSAGAGTVGGTQGYTYADGEPIFVVIRSNELGSVKVEGTQSLAPYFTFSQNNSGVNAGGYTLSVTPTANYAWKDGTFEAKDIGWNIVARVIKLPTFDGGTEKESGYSRGEQSAEIVTYDEKAMSVDVSEGNSANKSGRFDRGTVYAAHADVYTVTVTLNNQSVTNYVWNADGTDTAEKTLSWTILPEVIYAPSFAGAAEDGKLTTEFKDTLSGATGSWVATPEQQTAAVSGYDDGAMSFVVSGEGSYSGGSVFATNAGVYTVTVTLKNSADIQNFVWAEGVGSDGTVTLTWEITPKAVGIDVAQTNTERRVTYQSDVPSQTITAIEDYVTSGQGSAYFVFNENKYYQYQDGSYVICSEPQGYGDYYFYIKLKDTNNYKWSGASVSGGEAHLNDSLIDGSGVTKRFWFQIAKADYTVEVTFEGSDVSYIYGTVPSVKYAIDGENGEVQKAIDDNTITVSYYYLGIEGTDYGAGQNDELGSTDIPQGVGKYRVVVYIPEVEGGNYRAMYVGLDDEYTFEITPKKLTVTFTGDAFNDGYSFGYGKAAAASVSVDGYVLGDREETSPVTLAYFNGEDSLGSSFPTNVGNYTVVASVADPNYYIEDGSVGYNVTPADLTVTVEGQNITYGDPRDEWVLSATGWVKVYGDEQYKAAFLEAVKAAISCDYEQGSSNVGNYPITLNAPANIGDWAKNYNITYESGKQVSVSPRKLTVVITGGQDSYTYGDVIAHGYEFVNLYNSDEVTVTLTYTGTGDYNNTSAPENVGTYSVKASISGNKNYVLDTENTKSVQFTIGQRDLTIVIAKDHTTIYGEAAPDWTIAEYTNIVEKDRALLSGLVEIQGNFSCPYIARESGVNTYTVTLTEEALAAIRAGAGNYNIIVDEGSLTVSPRQITVNIADKTSIYGDEIVGLTADVDTLGGGYGLVPGDPDPWTLSAENISETSDAGTYTISGTATGGNYEVVQFNTGTYTITPRQVEIDFTLSGDEGGFTVTYSGKPQEMTAEVSGTVNGDVITAEVTYNTDDKSAPVNVNADGYTAKATLAGEKANNYYVSMNEDEYLRYAEQDFAIAKAKLTVETYETDGTVVYGDEAAFGYNITGFVNDETESVLEGKIGYITNYVPGAESGAVSGAYTVSYTEGSFTSGNYEISAAAETSFQVTAREVTLNLGSLIEESFVYGEAAGASAHINETLPESIKGDDLEFSYTYAGRDGTERDEADAGEYPTFAGKYTVTVTIGNQNYELTGTNSKDYVITQKLVHVKADDKEITYGDPVPNDYTISYTQADFVYRETAETAGINEEALKFDCEYVQGNDAATYSITASGLTSRNYTFEYEDGTLTVGKRTITVILSDDVSTYGDARDLYEQARVTAGSLYTGGTGGENTEDTAKEVYGFTVYRYDAETTEYLPFDGDFGSAETGAGTYYFVLVNNMPNNYVITVEGDYTVHDEEAGRHVIDPKSLQVDITGNNSVTYDGNSHAITAKIKTEEGVDDVSMLSHYTGKDGTDYDSDTAPTNAGVYTVTFRSSDPNYTSAEISATLTISPRTIDIVWNGGETETYTYDNKPKTVTAAYHPYVNGEMDEGQSIALTAEVTSYEAYTLQGGFAAASGAREFKDAGRYTFTVSFAETDPKNYVLPEVKTDTFTIERAAITVYIDDKTSEYGDDLAALTYRIEGDIYDAAETVFTLSTNATPSSNVGGNYEISGTVNEARGLNYIVAFRRNDETSSSNTAVYTIAPRALVVSATYNENNTIVYGDAVDEDLFALSYKRANDKSGAPFVNEGDEEKIGFSSGLYGYSGYAGGLNGTKAGTQINVNIDTTRMSLDNYSFTFEGEASFTVIERDISVNGSFKENLPTKYTSYALEAVMSADYIDGTIGGEVLGEHFDFTLTYFIQEEGEYKPVSGEIVNAGTYYITVALNNADTSSYELVDAGYIEWTVAKAELNISLDGDLSADGVQNVVVRYGNALDDSELFEYLVIEGLLGDDEQNYREDVVGNLKATHDYSVADINNPTAAGTRLPVTLAFEKELPNYVFANEGDDSHGTIEVAKRRINLSMNTYDDDGEVYGMYNGGEFEKPEGFWDIRAAKADVVGVSEYQGLVGDDKVGTDVTFTYIYYGTSNDGVWSHEREEGITQNPTLAGIYTVRVTIESENYIIYGGSPEHGGVEYVDLTYRILKQRVEAPAFVGDGIDNGNAQATGDAYMASVEFNSNVIGVVSDSWQATNGGQIISASMQGENMFIMTASAAGGYSVRLELKDPDNYVWEGDTGSDDNTPYWEIKWRIVTYSDVSIEITGITVNEVPYGLKDDLFGGETVKWFDVDGWVYGVSFAAEDIGVQVTFEGGDGVYAGAIEYEFQRSVSGGWDSASSSFLGAGTYRVRAIVADPNYERKESAWVYYTIDKQTVEVPTVENGVYNHGAAVTSKLVGFDNALMSEGLACEHVTLVYSGGAWYLQANVVSANHFIQIALTDPANYCWLQDGETLSRTSVQVNWTIERYKVKAPTGYSENFSAEYNGSIITFEYTDSEDRAYYRVSGASGTNAGSYTFTVSLVNTNNYEWEDKTTGSITVGWNIAKAANSWLDDEYSRAGWTYGGAPTAEKLPSAKFGNIAVAYYTDADCTIPIDFGAFTNGTPAGTYYVVVTVADSTNYTSPGPIKGEFTVGKAPVTVIWDGAEGLVYNGQIQEAPTASYNALLGQGSVELIVTPSFEGEFKDAGSSYTFTAAFKESDEYAANYYIASGGSTVRAIAAAEVHVEVLPQSAVYTGGKPDVLQEENQAYRISSGDTYSDFNLTFSIPEDAVDAGTYVIDAECSSTNYAVTFTGSALFTITPKDISISITAGGGTYGSVTYATATASDENAQKSLSLTYAGTPNGGGFTEFGPGGKPTEAGSYIVTATVSDGNYNVTGTNTAAFIIAKARVTVQPISDKPYNGNLQKAEPVVSCSVEEDGIYTVTDEGGTDVGNYAVRFEFGENKENNFVWFYNGSEVNGATMTLNFAITIVKAENNPVTLEKPDGWTYGDEAETLEANAAFGTPVLYYATDENGAYGTNVPVHAGTYWVKAVVSATTNYEGSESAAYEFTISALELETPEFADAETVYNGGAQTNAFTGYDRSMMTISSNSGALVTTDGFALRAMNAGEYYITFALSYSGGGQEGDYVWKDASGSETVTIKWTIRQAVNDWDGTYERDGWTYGQAASEEKIPGADFGTVVVEYFTDSALQNEYTGVFDGSTAAGTYYVRITVEGNTNYTGLSLGADGSLFFTVEVAQNGWKDDQNAYERDGWTYGDEATEETLPVPEFGNASVVYYTDSAHTKPYTGSFDSRTNAGIYYVVITVEGSENYSGITLNGQFEVEKRSLALPALADTADTAVETGDTLHNEIVGFDSSTMNMSELGSGITTIDGKLYLAAKDAGVYQITISLADTSNYQWTDGKDGDVTLVWTLRRAELESWTEESESRYPDVIVSADGGIHPLYTLEISSILEESYGDYDLSAYENAEIALGYDIGFTSGGEAVQPESAVTVRLKVTDEIASALGEGYTLLHLHGGEWSEVSYTVEDGYAVFTVTEFSAFLFITETPATSLVWLIIVLAVLLTVEIVLLVVAIVKRRKGRN